MTADLIDFDHHRNDDDEGQGRYDAMPRSKGSGKRSDKDVAEFIEKVRAMGIEVDE